MSAVGYALAGLGNPAPPHLPRGPEVKDAIARALAAAKAAWKKEPARIVSGLAAVVVFAAAKFSIVVPEAGIAQALGLVVPILLGGQLVRSKVTPTP